MKYHAPTNQFTVAADDLQRAVHSLTYAMRHIRRMAGLPLDKYRQEGPLTDADHAQRGIIDAAKKLGIDLGADWGSDLDLRDPDDILPNAEIKENERRAGEDSSVSPGSQFLEHAQAAFMEWIKVVEYDLGVSEGHFQKCEKAFSAGDLETFGHHFGKSWGHLQNALKTVRSATQRGFDAGNESDQEHMPAKEGADNKGGVTGG